MRIDAEKLSRHLQGGLKPIYVIYGDSPLIVQEAADAIRQAARAADFSEREVLIVEQGFKWERLLEAKNSLSLFAEKRIIDLRIPTGKPGVDGGKTLQALAENPAEDVLTIVTLPKLDRQGLSAKWFEALDSAGIAVAANSVELKALPQWIAGRLARQQQQADQETLEFLANRVEGNLLAAHQEIQKLSLLLPAGKISFDDAREAVLDVARFDIFQLGEAMLSGNSARFVRILQGLQGEGVAEPLVLWQISEETRMLLKVLRAEKSGKSPDQAMRDARVWGPRQSLVTQAKRRMSVPALRKIMLAAARIDKMVKGLQQGDIWDEFLQIGLQYAAKR